jgi:hypothetical protein
MALTNTLPVLAALLFVSTTAYLALVEGVRGRWIVPAAASVLFAVFSFYTFAIEGPTGFWTEHTRNLWGVQIWIDLLLAVAIGFFFLAREARALDMRLLPWLAFVLTTGCIGLCAMLARVLYLRDRTA